MKESIKEMKIKDAENRFLASIRKELKARLSELDEDEIMENNFDYDKLSEDILAAPEVEPDLKVFVQTVLDVELLEEEQNSIRWTYEEKQERRNMGALI